MRTHKLLLLYASLKLAFNYPGRWIRLLNGRYVRILVHALRREPITLIAQNFVLKLLSPVDESSSSRLFQWPDLVIHLDHVLFFRSVIKVSGWVQSLHEIEQIELLQSGIQFGRIQHRLIRPDLKQYFPRQRGSSFGFEFVGKHLGNSQLSIRISDERGKEFYVHTEAEAKGARVYRRIQLSDAIVAATRLPGLQVIRRYKVNFLVYLQGVKEDHKELMLNSLKSQTYTGWSRIETLASLSSTNPSTYVLLLNEGSIMPPHALEELARFIHYGQNHATVIYWDEDRRADDGSRHSPHFKPAFSPEYLLSWNYIGDHLCIRSDFIGKYVLVLKKDGCPIDAQGFLFGAMIEQVEIAHLPEILSSRSEKDEWPDGVDESGKKLREWYFDKKHIKAGLEKDLNHRTWRVAYAIDEAPTVAILIPFRDKPNLLRQCVESVITKTIYTRYRIYLLDNGSVEAETRYLINEYLTRYEHIKHLTFDFPFNYSRINNRAVAAVDADYVMLLNNDTQVISSGWLQEMLGLIQQSKVAAVGACLLYGDHTIQHAGVIVGLGGVAEHAFKHYDDDEEGYFKRLCTRQDYMACTAACLLVDRALYIAAGGLDEQQLPIAFNDVDLCLSLKALGYRIVYSPYARLYHHESASRLSELDQDRWKAAGKERKFLRMKWRHIIEQGDPYYSQGFSYSDGSFSIL